MAYLGHIVTNEGVAVDSVKVEKVRNWPIPQSARDVQQFLGLANYYRRFVESFSTTARPLHHLTEKSVHFEWTSECQEPFDSLRTQLTSTPSLAYPNFKKPFLLDTDASDSGIGDVLSQFDEAGREHVIAYGSGSLTKAERQYCVTTCELLAVVTFVKHFRTY